MTVNLNLICYFQYVTSFNWYKVLLAIDQMVSLTNTLKMHDTKTLTVKGVSNEE
jgi:hypothetical protein